MYINILVLNIRSRAAASYLYDNEKMHKILCLTTQSSRRDSKILYKIREENDAIYYYVQYDRVLPHSDGEMSYLIVGDKEEKALIFKGAYSIDALLDNEILNFHLTAAPSKKKRISGCQNTKRSSISSQSDRVDWVTSKLEEAGVNVVSIRETSKNTIYFKHNTDKGSRGRIPGFNYIGVINVVNRGKFEECLREGFGVGKCYGMGLMLLR